MKLYLSSVDVPTPNDLAGLLGKTLDKASVALIPNAKDFYSNRARNLIVEEMVATLKSIGLTVTTVDLRDYSDCAQLKKELTKYDLIWAMGGNTLLPTLRNA